WGSGPVSQSKESKRKRCPISIGVPPMAAFNALPRSAKKLVILSHNPLIPALVDIDLLKSRSSDAVAAGIHSPGPLTKTTKPHERRWDTERGIVKLVLQITHQCNLACTYCITDAGKWGQEGINSPYMTPETAARAVRFFAEQYRSIGTVYLFGGEPTLNLPAIRAVCDETEQLVAQGVLETMPDVGFTSNGMRADTELVRLLLE